MNQHIVTFFLGAGGWWLLSAFADSLPKPGEKDSRLYLFAYNFAHALAANISRIGGITKQ